MIVIVAGMHRSGTSMLAGLLHQNGIKMGTDEYFFPKPLPENPAGFFEDIRARCINDRVLAANSYDVQSFDSSIPEILHNPALSEMQQYIAQRSQESEFWGWKDPRTCLTLNHWLTALGDKRTETKVLVPFRNPTAIGASLRARGNAVVQEQAELLYDTYHIAIYSAASVYPDVPVYAISYDLLLDKPDSTISTLEDFLVYDLPNRTHLDKKLRRN